MSPFNRPNKRRRNFFSSTLIRAVLIALGVSILFFIVRAVVKQTGNALPPLYADVVTSTLLPKRVLVDRITTLQGTVAAVNAQMSELSVLRDENIKLKKELGRTPTPKGILANVVEPPSRSFYDTLVIDAGSVEGIEVGKLVVAFDSVALGTISSVTAHSATVQLFSAAGTQTPGTASGSDVTVTLTGRGNGEYEVRMPRDVHFDTDGVISYQSNEVTILAKIEKIITDPRDPFQRLLAKAPVNLENLKWVIVK